MVGIVTERDVAKQVLEHIRARGPSRARDIADALGVDRTIVNRILFGALRGKVRQDREYRWSLADTAAAGEPAGGGTTNASEKLFAYYLDCLSQDDDSGVSTFADSKLDVDYAELEEWPFDTAQPNFGAEPVRKLVGRQRRDAR